MAPKPPAATMTMGALKVACAPVRRSVARTPDTAPSEVRISSTRIWVTAATPRSAHWAHMPFTMKAPTALPSSGRWMRLTEAPPEVPRRLRTMPRS